MKMWVKIIAKLLVDVVRVNGFWEYLVLIQTNVETFVSYRVYNSDNNCLILQTTLFDTTTRTNGEILAYIEIETFPHLRQ